MCVKVCQCNSCDRKDTCADCIHNKDNKNVNCSPPLGKGVQNCLNYKPFKYVEIPKIEYNQIYEEMFLKMNYKSPIEAIRHEMEMRFENDVMKAVQQNDIFVDKDELLKALQYDRDQYTKGFQDGCGDKMDKLIEQVKTDTVRKMQERLKMCFGTYILGYKIPLTETLKIIDQIAKEMLEDKQCT